MAKRKPPAPKAAAPFCCDYTFNVGMPHLVPHRLSEVELCKALGDLQWRSIARAAQVPASELRDEAGHRLWASMVSIELGLGGERHLEDFDEGAELSVWNRVGLFGKRLVEGLFLFDREPLPAELLARAASRDELRASGRPYLYMTNAFVAHTPGGAPLVTSPACFREQVPAGLELEQMPAGIAEQMRVERTGAIETPGEDELIESLVELPARDGAPLRYRLVPESDISGAGLLYCARSVAICNNLERRHLCGRLHRPLSAQAVSFLSTELRQIFYFGSAAPGETLVGDVEVLLLPVPPSPPARWRTPFALLSRVDLSRASDGVLITSSLARKTLRIPGAQKSAVAEAERFLAGMA
jgi:probable biosynthetic protein (TIGR04098 family)